MAKQLGLGLDAVVRLESWHGVRAAELGHGPGLPGGVHLEVEVRQWRTEEPDGPILHKQYVTPFGSLKAEVRQTEDWPHGDDVPLFDDFLVPRSRKFLVETEDDVRILQSLLAPPTGGEIEALRRNAAEARAFANEHGLALQWGSTTGLEAGAWLCGLQQLVVAGMDRPEWVDELCRVLHGWTVSRMAPVLEVGVDLLVRRGWYECADFWSPALFRRFVYPSLRAEAELAHQAGAKFGYIMTSGTMPLLDMMMEAGVDVLIGVDPVQGKGTDMAAMRERTRGRMCLWGGVNGYITVEQGEPQDVRREVEQAMRALGPDGFILSPVDDVPAYTPRADRNVEALIEAWEDLR